MSTATGDEISCRRCIAEDTVDTRRHCLNIERIEARRSERPVEV
jgi:hypothetical protein